MLIGTLTKQPWEVIDSSVDFSKRVPLGDSIGLTDLLCTDSLGADAKVTIISVAPAPVVAGMLVKFRVMAGTDGADYLIRIRVTTTGNQKLEGDVRLEVRD